MAVHGWEPVMRGLQDTIDSRLGATLAEIHNRYQDNIALPMPKSYRRWADQSLNEYPVVYILPGGEGRAEEQTGGWHTSVLPVKIAIEIEQPTQEATATAILRYEAALRSVVLRAPYPDPCHMILLASTLPGDVFESGRGSAFRAWHELTFTCKVFEEQLT